MPDGSQVNCVTKLNKNKMNVSDLITEFGAYYQNQGQNANRIYRTLRAQFVTQMLFTLVLTDETIWRASKTTMTRLVQPFQKAWTPIGLLTFTPAEIRMFKVKMDHELYPDDIDATWLGFLASENLDRKEWPLVRWLVENEILPQIQEDLEMNEIYSGVYAAPTPGDAGAAGTAMDGIKKVINDHITGGRITPIATGALETDAKLFVAQVEDWAKQINVRYRMRNMPVSMSEDNFELFREGYDLTYNVNYRQDTNNTKIRYKNLEVMGLPSMVGSNKLIATPKENAILLKKRSINENRVQLESEDRRVKMWTDFWIGIGYILPEVVFTNDQDLV